MVPSRLTWAAPGHGALVAQKGLVTAATWGSAATCVSAASIRARSARMVPVRAWKTIWSVSPWPPVTLASSAKACEEAVPGRLKVFEKAEPSERATRFSTRITRTQSARTYQRRLTPGRARDFMGSPERGEGEARLQFFSGGAPQH